MPHQQNWVVKHGYQFYQINVPAGFASLEIDVAPSYGDPDLYVDLGSPHISSGGHHNYSSNTAAGEDRIVVRPTDTMFQRYCDVSKPCPVFITVYGYKESGYTVTAATASTSKTILDGVPYLDHVGVRTYVVRGGLFVGCLCVCVCVCVCVCARALCMRCVRLQPCALSVNECTCCVLWLCVCGGVHQVHVLHAERAQAQHACYHHPVAPDWRP